MFIKITNNFKQKYWSSILIMKNVPVYKNRDFLEFDLPFPEARIIIENRNCLEENRDVCSA